jgi:SAM-dependent methyltransferase
MNVVLRGLLMATAAYDEVADWYADEFLPRIGIQAADTLGVDRALTALLGDGDRGGVCLDVGCGTGARASQIRELGWSPVGVDLSAAMLRRARGQLPIAQADAGRLPLRDGCVPAAVAVMMHTDVPEYPAVVREVARVLRPGGRFVHVGVHPCFCGGFADRSDPRAVLVRPGYLDQRWTKASWTDQGVRDKVGATHVPLPDLLHAFLDAGLALERFAEGGAPTPVVLAVSARKRDVTRSA